MSEKVEDIFHITIGQDHSSGRRFLTRERRLGAKDPKPSWFSIHDVESWLIDQLMLEPFKRYSIKVTVQLIGEVNSED